MGHQARSARLRAGAQASDHRNPAVRRPGGAGMSSTHMSRREKQQHTRSSLLKAAGKVFCRSGLEGASVDQVAQAAGYTKGAVYGNFQAKEELFLVMLDERFARELERIDAALAGSGEPHTEARAAGADFLP